MANMLKVAVSTDPASNLEELLCYIKKINTLADFIHCDVMSSDFVDRDTINYKDVHEVYLKTLCPLDVHLMVGKPIKYIKEYAKAGAQIITVHYEAFKDKKKLVKTLNMIRKKKILSGIAINPDTDVIEIMPYLAYADLVLVMSVYAGASGQKFMESTNLKVKKLKQIRDDYGANYYIEVDGGITPEISKRLKVYGADIVVSGNYVFKAEDRAKAIEDLK